MQVRDGLVTMLGVSCLASAAVLALLPRASTRTLGMPESRALGRGLALRDATIGVALLCGPSRTRALAARQLSDAFDAGLAIASVVRGRRGSAPLLTITGAVALSASAWLLRRPALAPPNRERALRESA
jgi:hypothetical protein